MDQMCREPLHKGSPKHHGHKGDPGVTSGICGLSDPSVGEGPGRWEHFPLTETRSHKGKAMNYA
jgi:hypothetical protein